MDVINEFLNQPNSSIKLVIITSVISSFIALIVGSIFKLLFKKALIKWRKLYSQLKLRSKGKVSFQQMKEFDQIYREGGKPKWRDRKLYNKYIQEKEKRREKMKQWIKENTNLDVD